MNQNITKAIFMAAFGAFALASCGDKDLYDPQYTTTQYAENFTTKIGDVNPAQTWSTIVMRQAKISVNLGLAEEYTVAVYTANPLFDSNASMLAMAKVREAATTQLAFDAPASQQNFYVGVFDETGRAVAENVSLTDNVLVANIGVVASRAVEDASVYPTYVKTLDNYLNPTLDLIHEVQPYATPTIADNTLSVATMQAYTAITDDIIVNETSNGNRTLSDASWYYDPADFPAHGDGKHYRVAAGTEVTEVFNINATYNSINEAVIYVEGKLHLNGNTLNGPTIVVGAGGEIVIDGTTNMSNAGRLIVMAGGKVTGASGVEFNVNNGAACYNAGTIEFAGQLNVNGSDTYNRGTINVDVLRNTAGGRFINFGKITARTNMEAADSYNSTIINGCYMHFTENAGIGTLTLLDNSRLDVDGRAEFNIGTQTLYNLSEINAGGIYLNSTVFAGPTAAGSYAVVKTAKMWANQGADLGATGNLYFDWSDANLVNHQGEADFNSTTDNGYTTLSYIRAQNFKYVNEASAPFSIPAGDCTGNGYNPGGGGGEEIIPIPNNPVWYSIAFEDLGDTDDFDFNDIVLYIAHDVNAGTATAQLVAAGGTLSVNVKYDGTTIITKNDGRMTNTTSKGAVIASVPNLTFTSATTDLPKFSIEVIADGGVSRLIESATETGKAPQAITIPGQWAWPSERTSITTAYPDFAAWVKGTNDNGWYNNPVNEAVIK